MLEKLYRQTVLGIANNPAIASFAQKQGWDLGVRRFVAGETLEEAVTALHAIEAEGKYPILDLLGEHVDTQEGASLTTDQVVATLDYLETTTLSRYMSIKPSQLGLGLSTKLAMENAWLIAERAKEMNAHICLDMENYPYVDGTLELHHYLFEGGYHNVSTVLQSYLRRSMNDLRELLTLKPRPTLRIVKGAYKESEEVAYQDKTTVDKHFLDMVFMGLEAGAHINIATHDEAIINTLKAFIFETGAKKDSYEFQLLYGVKPKLQQALVDEGYCVRIYVPYGEDWYGYFSRRLAERPANLLFVLQGLRG